MKPRVVITGMGVISALGEGVPNTRSALRAGRCGIDWIRQFTATPRRIGGEARPAAGELPAGHGRMAELARRAQAEALAAAGLEANPPRPRPEIGCSWALGKPSVSLPELRKWLREAPDAAAETLSRRYATELESNGWSTSALLRDLARQAGAGGESFSCYTACASGNDALGVGKRWIERGEADLVIAGGSDAQLDLLSILEFELLSALAPAPPHQDPATACRPFDRRRAGFVVGEGAAALVLENEDHARARGAAPLAQLAGYGGSLDAHGLTKCHPQGLGAALAMTRALADAGRAPADVGYINAHGTGTVLNDRAEAAGLAAAFGPLARRVPVSSTKAMTGHLIAAASAVEAVLTILAMRDGFVPPSLNYAEFDPECDLNVVAGGALPLPFSLALSNGFGFGGQNASVVLAAA